MDARWGTLDELVDEMVTRILILTGCRLEGMAGRGRILAVLMVGGD